MQDSTRALVTADNAPHAWRGFFEFLGLGPLVGLTVGPVIDGALSDGFGWSTLFWSLCTAYFVWNLVRLTATSKLAGKEASNGHDDRDTSTAVSSGNL
ncbi:hypothetical protein ONZ45_g3419 [Pleurotus djamor]|nr:hypothetical protein ONZ45_g3419 [Pleurotus djamor]